MDSATRYIKLPSLLTLTLLALSACGQAPGAGKDSIAISNEASAIYKNIFDELCDCTSYILKNNKPTSYLDICNNTTISKHRERLKALGLDPATPEGSTRLKNEVYEKLYQNCPDLLVLTERKIQEEEGGKLLFRGELVSQKKLPNGLYEIVLKDNKDAKLKTFFAKTPLDEVHIRKFKPGYELTLEYEVVKNSKTNKDEYFLKEGGTSMSVGAVEVSNQ